MASKHASRALRQAVRQAPRIQQRTLAAAVNAAARPAWQRTAVPAIAQQSRGMKTVDFAGDKEVVYGTRKGLINPLNLYTDQGRARGLAP